MKRQIILISLVGFLSLISCDDEQNTIDKSILMNYLFQYTQLSELENGHTVMNDTIVYSFINDDSIVGTRYKYLEVSDGVTEFTGTETYVRLYLIKGNSIMFDYTDINVIYPSDYLLSLKWDVTSMDTKELKVNLYNNQTPAGNTVLKCINKEQGFDR